MGAMDLGFKMLSKMVFWIHNGLYRWLKVVIWPPGRMKTSSELTPLELRRLLELRPLRVALRHGQLLQRKELSALRIQAWCRGELARVRLRRSPEAEAQRTALASAARAAAVEGTSAERAAAAGEAVLASAGLSGISLQLQVELVAEAVAGRARGDVDLFPGVFEGSGGSGELADEAGILRSAVRVAIGGQDCAAGRTIG